LKTETSYATDILKYLFETEKDLGGQVISIFLYHLRMCNQNNYVNETVENPQKEYIISLFLGFWLK